jgi:hypothetical protein
MAEQHHNDQHHHDEPDEAVSAATIIAAAITVVTAASAEQQNENDDQKQKTHGAILKLRCAGRTEAGPKVTRFCNKSSTRRKASEVVIADLETRMREAANDLDFEEAARMRTEIKRLRATELAVVDDPTAKRPGVSPAPRRGGRKARRGGAWSEPRPQAGARGPEPESKPFRGPRSTGGRSGMRGGFRPRGRGRR